MPHPNDTTKNIHFAIFDCPKEITEEQKQEIRSFVESINSSKLF